MNTPPVASSRAPNHAHNQTGNNGPRTAGPAPRQHAERQTVNDRFAAKLERDDATRKGAQRETIGTQPGVDEQLLPALQRGDEYTGENGGQSDLGQREALMRLTAATQLAAVSAPQSAAFDTALLNQIAAHIAEGVPVVGSSEASVEFPAGSLVQSALIRREADGSIAIRLAGVDPRLSALQNGRAQAELRSALAGRRLAVHSITLEDTQDDQDSRRSLPIARAV